MISNAQEFETVLRQIEELRAQRDSLLRDAAANPFQLHIEVTGVEKMMARLQNEISEFEADQSKSKRSKEKVAV